MRSFALILLLPAVFWGEASDQNLIDQALRHPGGFGLGLTYSPDPQVDALWAAARKSNALTEKLIDQLGREAKHETTRWQGIDGGSSSGFAIAYAITANASREEEPHIIACFESRVFPRADRAFVDYLLESGSPLRVQTLQKLFDISAFMEGAKKRKLDPATYVEQKAKETAYYSQVPEVQQPFVYTGISQADLDYVSTHVFCILHILERQSHRADVQAAVATWLDTDDPRYWRMVMADNGSWMSRAVAAYAPEAVAVMLLRLKTR